MSLKSWFSKLFRRPRLAPRPTETRYSFEPPSPEPPRPAPAAPPALAIQAPLTTGDLLQFPGARGATTVDIVVGFDFGTSSSKVVLQSPFALSGRVMATRFPRSVAHHSCSMLLPTVLHEDPTGRLSLAEVDGRRHRSLKVALLRASEMSPDAEPRAAAYLALALRQVREDFLASQREHAAGAALATPRADIDIAVLPEIVAEVIGYARSRQRRHGLHLVLDVGASTLDVCSFSLHDAHGEDSWALLTADVQPLGPLDLHHRRMDAADHQPPFDVFPDDIVGPLPDWWRYNLPSSVHKRMKRCEAAYVEEAERVLMKSLMDLRRHRDPHSPHWRQGLPVFVCGGGAGASVANDLIAAVDEEARRCFVDFGGLKWLPIPLPDMAAEPVPVRRMAVAYGLSFQAVDIGTIDRPGSVENVVAPPSRRDGWMERFVGKDQV